MFRLQSREQAMGRRSLSKEVVDADGVIRELRLCRFCGGQGAAEITCVGKMHYDCIPRAIARLEINLESLRGQKKRDGAPVFSRAFDGNSEK